MMKQFAWWRSWAAQLDDDNFSYAWLYLGVRNALERNGLVDAGGFDHLIVRDSILAAMRNGGALHWEIPDTVDDYDQRDIDYVLKVRDADPVHWAWCGRFILDALDKWKMSSCLIIRVRKNSDEIKQWLAPLLLLKTHFGSIFHHSNSLSSDISPGWPLRIAGLDDNGANRQFLAINENHAALSAMTQNVFLTRQRNHCDLLIYRGTPAALMAALTKTAFHIRAHALILWTDREVNESDCEALAAALSCGGVISQQYASPPLLTSRLDEFVGEFSLDIPFNLAWGKTFGAEPDAPVPWFSTALAQLRLASLETLLTARLRRLVGEAPRPRPREQRTRGAGGLVIADRFERARSMAADGLAVEATLQSAARYLQQQSFVLSSDGVPSPARGGFFTGKAALIDIRIGPDEHGWQGLTALFPDEQLPRGRRGAELILWLTEPTQLPEPLMGQLFLPEHGASSVCHLMFRPVRDGYFEGRLSVLHRGRVVQTAVLRAQVRTGKASEPAPAGDGTPALADFVPVRRRIGELQQRRCFDLAFVENHTSEGQPRTVALSDTRAWIADSTVLTGVSAKIGDCLSAVAQSVGDFKEGLDGDAGAALFHDLASAGAFLYQLLIKQQLERPGNQTAIKKLEFIQIVSTRGETTLPLEFVYDFAAPAASAPLCPHWRAGLSTGKCATECGGGNASRICPLGFWGLSKVIERHQFSPEHACHGRDFFLQSEPSRASAALQLSGPVILASSHRVKQHALNAVQQTLETYAGQKAIFVSNWRQWEAEVMKHNPRLIISMPHTEGSSYQAALEIGNESLPSLNLTPGHVCPPPAGVAPIVALLGCDVAQTQDGYGSHIMMFNHCGAAVVIATIATVFNEHAASAAALLCAELFKKRDAPFVLGEAMREIRRQALLQNLIMPLCMAAYGDADWRIVH